MSHAAIVAQGLGIPFVSEVKGATPTEVAGAVAGGLADGIGLFRAEFFYLQQAAMPSVREETDFYLAVFEAADAAPMTFRLFDFGGDKIPCFFPPGEVSYGVFGRKGIRYLLANPELLVRQVSCLANASLGRPFRLLVPFITTEREIIAARALIEQTLAATNTPMSRCTLGAMIEVPSAFFALERLLPHVDAISIGTNDLGQLTFAWERENSPDSDLLNEIHRLMLRMTNHCAAVAQAVGKDLTVCGEIASDINVLPALIQAGVRSISVAAATLEQVHAAVGNINTGAAATPAAHPGTSVREVARLVLSVLADTGPTTLADLAGRIARLSANEITMAVGWLTRDEKVELNQSEQGWTVGLLHPYNQSLPDVADR